MNVLITGATGFTGHYLTNALIEKSYKIFGLVSSTAIGTNYFHADVRSKDALICLLKSVQPDYIIHLAAVASVDHGNREDFYSVNLIGTVNLLEAVYDLGLPIQKIIIASSANVYGTKASSPITEDQSPDPLNDYAVSKLGMEYAAKLWFDKLPILLTRPFNYTGVGQSTDFIIPKIVDHFRRKEQRIELGNIGVERDFSDVRDTVEAYCQLLASDIDGTVFNICSGAPTPITRVIEICEEIAGYRIEVAINPNYIRSNEIQSLCGSNAKLQRLVGAKPRYTIEDTIRWMYQG